MAKSNDDSLTTEQEIEIEMILCTHYGFKQHPCYAKPGFCNICLEDIEGSYVLETSCGHVFDYYCLLYTIVYKILKCPECHTEYKKS